ncbi:hypothetical protein LOK49_LG04G00519 [Camellia lanceoleosa]|uniref:Uncharacterized protein n=1 Tax=Camellia lanceoleosa TaxID=1840588 RepID=A0ACC0HVQ0_9ERIC|nr:hypothetical protein LOK49_LG04G00519 [Camellia lanceoleosa]
MWQAHIPQSLLIVDVRLFDIGLALAREHAPSIIFMDEINSIGLARTESGFGNGDSEVQRTMLELLNQLDGFEASNKIKAELKEKFSRIGQKSDKVDVTLQPEELEVMNNVLHAKSKEEEKLSSQREDFSDMVAENEKKRKRKMQEKDGKLKKKDFKF